MKSTLNPFAPSLAKWRATRSSSPSTCAQAIHRMIPTPFCLPYAMMRGTSTFGWNFQMFRNSLQPSSRMTYSMPFSAAKSMNRSYVFVLQPPSPWLSKAFHQSHATLPGRTHEKSVPAAAGAASAWTMSASQNPANESASTNVRHGNVRVPSVSVR